MLQVAIFIGMWLVTVLVALGLFYLLSLAAIDRWLRWLAVRDGRIVRWRDLREGKVGGTVMVRFWLFQVWRSHLLHSKDAEFDPSDQIRVWSERERGSVIVGAPLTTWLCWDAHATVQRRLPKCRVIEVGEFTPV